MIYTLANMRTFARALDTRLENTTAMCLYRQ